jgi:hypothetical protein
VILLFLIVLLAGCLGGAMFGGTLLINDRDKQDERREEQQRVEVMEAELRALRAALAITRTRYDIERRMWSAADEAAGQQR